tara:strand:+ start:5452 stop:5817 length:366 start_codon:yes stop_codon:yes gene_type:complete
MILPHIFNLNSEHLEGPVFDHKENLPYFVSILDYLLYCYYPTISHILSIKLDSPFSCNFLLDRKRILIVSKNGYFEVNFNKLQKQFSFQINIENSESYNDGIKDPEGRFINEKKRIYRGHG